jgi:hypothetical protein
MIKSTKDREIERLSSETRGLFAENLSISAISANPDALKLALWSWLLWIPSCNVSRAFCHPLARMYS